MTGCPEAMGCCHCEYCRSWAAAPVNGFTLWSPEKVKVTKGAESIGTFHKTERSHWQFCRFCGGHLMTMHPAWDLIDVYAAIIPDLAFQPQVHVHYAEKVVAVCDGLPKMKERPKEMGGSGDILPKWRRVRWVSRPAPVPAWSGRAPALGRRKAGNGAWDKIRAPAKKALI